MKAKIILLAFFAGFWSNGIIAQDKTTVTATNDEISDNLDLRAVASIFGDSENLEDFERRLNDPKTKISNLDLNQDREVDYLRVIESVEGNTHLIIVQAVLEKDVFQDVATVEVERGSNNQVQVQVVGDTYMYGNNYIYEPIYVHTPLMYDYFWATGYHPYYSSWYWGYYPSYYYAWNPYPVYTYRRNIHNHINNYHVYNYVNVRRSQRAVALYNGHRSNGYEVRNPGRSFTQRNNVANRHELDLVRSSNAPSRTSLAADSGIRLNTSGIRNTTPNKVKPQDIGSIRSSAIKNTSAAVKTATKFPTRTSSENTAASVPSTTTRTITVPSRATTINSSTPVKRPSTNGTTSRSVSVNKVTEAVTRPASSAATIRSTENTGTRVQTPSAATRSQSLGGYAPARNNTSIRTSAPVQSSSRSSLPSNMGSQRNGRR
jgi:hypothetical protein